MEQYLLAMLKSLDEKSSVLQELLKKTARQGELVEEEAVDWDAFDRLVDEKDELIDRLDKLDDGFQIVFDRIKDELAEKKSAYPEQIKEMQRRIAGVTEMATRLISAEADNRERINRRFTAEKKKINMNKTTFRVAASYYNNMNQINLIDPQLMDKKK